MGSLLSFTKDRLSVKVALLDPASTVSTRPFTRAPTYEHTGAQEGQQKERRYAGVQANIGVPCGHGERGVRMFGGLLFRLRCWTFNSYTAVVDNLSVSA